MTATDIEVFLAVCRHKNISKAAEALHITQATLSIRLKALEDELGYPLLLRGKGKRSLSLTSQGQVFYQLALQHQDILQKMRSVDQTLAQQSLQLSTISSVGNYLLPPVLERFMEDYPQFRLSVYSMEAEAAALSILHGKTDMALSTAKMETDQIAATPFLRDPFTVLCAANAPYPDAVTMKDLPLWHEVYVKWSAEYEFWHRSTFDSHPHQFHLELMGQLELFLSRPNKWALVPRSVANFFRGSSKLRECVPTFSIPDRSVYILRPKDNADTMGIQCFVETLRAVLRPQYGDHFLL